MPRITLGGWGSWQEPKRLLAEGWGTREPRGIVGDMLTVEEALEAILSRIDRPLPVERVEVMGSLGRVLAEPIVSRSTIPPWPNSSMDGYAVRAGDTRGEPVELAVVGRIIAGSMPSRVLRAGETMRIFTGAPLPEGADAVVPQEDVDADDVERALEAFREITAAW